MKLSFLITHLIVLLTFASCFRPEVRSIDKNTEDLSKSVDRMAQSFQHMEELLFVYAQLWAKQQELDRAKLKSMDNGTSSVSVRPYSDEEEFDSGFEDF